MPAASHVVARDMRWMGYALPIVATVTVMLRVGTAPAPMDLELARPAAAAVMPPVIRERLPSPKAQHAAAIFDAARAYDGTTSTLETLSATGEDAERELADAAVLVGETYIASFEASPADQERAEIAAMQGRAEILRRIARLYHDDLDTQRMVVEQLDALAMTIESRGLPLPTSCFRREARALAADTALAWKTDADAWALLGAMVTDVDPLLALRAYHRCARLDPTTDCAHRFETLAASYQVPLPPDLQAGVR